MSFISGMFENGSLQATERLVEFTGKRQKVLANNIANLSTPYFKPRDMDPREFQSVLQDAIDRRRSRPNGGINPLMGRLQMRSTANLRYRRDHHTAGHTLSLDPRPTARNDNILFHDQNNRDVERLMQSLAENAMAHNAGIELLRNQFGMLRMAIQEQP